MADSENNGGGKDSGGGLGDLVKAESMVQVALVLPIACLIGWAGGDALDKHFHTGWCMITGVILGAVAGFTQMFRTASRFLNRGPKP